MASSLGGSVSLAQAPRPTNDDETTARTPTRFSQAIGAGPYLFTWSRATRTAWPSEVQPGKVKGLVRWAGLARVLHIEDDPRNRLLVRKLLSADGHEVIDAADGLEGVRLAIAQRPDIVLVDLNIHGLDGFEVTLRLRPAASLDGVPIVAITAEGDRDTSFAVGCDGFLQKPIDARNFATQVASYIGGRRERMMSTPDVMEGRLRVQS